MKKKLNIIVILIFLQWLQFGYCLSRPIAVQPDITYQTGVQIIVSTNYNSLTDLAIGVPYATVMSTSSVNASLAIMGTRYYLNNDQFGWKMSVGSVTTTSLSIHLSITSAFSQLYYLKISYLISSNSQLDINYHQLTFTPPEPVANHIGGVFGTSCCCSITCRQYDGTIAYNNKLNPKVIVLLSGFSVSSYGTGSKSTFGISLDPSNPVLSSFSIKVTVYSQANLVFVSFFSLSFNSVALNIINKKATIAQRGYLGCFYTTLGCSVGGSISNTQFNTVDTSVIQYTPSMFLIGLDRMILKYTGNPSVTGEFQITTLTQNSDSKINVQFSFTGNTQNRFNTGISYFTMQTFNCNPVGIDMYAVSGSNFCDTNCNNDVQQYVDSNNVCSPCSAQCYRCNTLSTICLACLNSQNRVLSGNSCVCDVNAGFYDDLSSLICPQCHYSCKTCNGGTSSQCTSCLSTNFRTHNSNSCPCNSGYYNANAAICVICHYTCRTGAATCISGAANGCATCNAAKFRTYLATSTCGCMTGYYDNATSNQQCSQCHYSCLTCTGTNVNCISCDLGINFRSLSSNRCSCVAGYYDNSVPICAPCHPTCLTCTGPLISNCITCDSAANRQINVNTCVCKQHYYDLSNSCLSCHHSCETCSNNPSNACLTCNATARRTFQISTSTCTCNPGTLDTGSQYCQSCNPSCLTCSITATSCDSCHSNPGRIKLGNVCLCSSNYADVSFNGFCTLCHYSCLTCSNGAANGCQTCSNSRILTSNQCLCPIGFYDTGSSVVCQACHANCFTCISGISTGCRSCQSLYYRTLSPSPTGTCICQNGYYQTGVLICSQCSPYCLTCSIINTNCTSCDSATNHRQSAANNVCTCMAGYYQSGAAICPSCHSTCRTCNILPNNCTTCYSDRTLSNNICYCNFGTYEVSLTSCLTCAASCLSCSGTGTTCLSCPANSNRVFNINSCPCVDGYYQNGVAICPPCSYTCLTCSLLNSCTACPINTFRTYNANNACPCNTGYYDNGNKICAACSPYCLSCLSYSQCQTCNSTLFRSHDSTYFTCPCIGGYYDNSINIDCKVCHYSCLTCYGGTSSNCNSCASLRTMTAMHSCPCNSGLYQFSTSCNPCSTICRTCSLSATNCTSCPVNSYLSNYMCYCNTGYYRNGLICDQCHVQCQNCNTTNNNCLTCNPAHGSILNGSICICLSTHYKHPTSLICISCHQYCLTCSAGTNTSCLSCHSSMFRSLNGSNSCVCMSGHYDPGSAICLLCTSPCLNCLGGSVLNCTSCISGYNLIGSSCMPIIVCTNYYFQGNCLSSCPNTTYNNGALICTKCINNCLTCLSATFCTTCKNGFYLQNNICSLVCSANTYVNTANSSCTICPSQCLRCSLRNSTIMCQSCNTGYYLNISNCINNCPILSQTHLIVDNMCVSCLNNCQTCANLSYNGCLSCKTNYNLHLGMCLTLCPVGFYDYNSLCFPCQSNCQSCVYSKCVTCITGYYVSTNGKCSQLKYFLNQNLQQIPCHSNCLTCNSISFSSCISCTDYRGDYSRMAISGYCDCWKGSIDVGNGKCDKQSYESVKKANEVLVTFTTSLNYLSSISGVISMNYFAPVMLVSYQQLYSNFYFLNSSSVLQTDEVLQKYSQSNFNRLIQSFSENQKSANTFSRLLKSSDIYQKQQSLFMRGYSWKYLIDWGLYTFIMITIMWFIIIVMICLLKKIKKYYSEDSNAFKIAKVALMIFRQNLAIVIHMLTINDVTLYACASFKILIQSQYEINIVKLIFSTIMFIYYIGYLFRLFVACYKFNGQEEEQSKFAILYSSIYSIKKKSFLCRVYLPMMMLKSMIISLALVFLAFKPQAQIVTCLLVFLVFTVYSFIYCPYFFYLKFFVHIFQIIFIFQLLLLLITIVQPQVSKIGPAYGLITLNYIQIASFLVLTLAILFTKLFDLKCWQIKEKRIIPFKKQQLQEQNYAPIFHQKKNYIEQTKQNISIMNDSSFNNIQKFDKRLQFNLPDQYVMDPVLQKKIQEKNKAQIQHHRRRRRDKVIGEEQDLQVIKLQGLQELANNNKRRAWRRSQNNTRINE